MKTTVHLRIIFLNLWVLVMLAGCKKDQEDLLVMPSESPELTVFPELIVAGQESMELASDDSITIAFSPDFKGLRRKHSIDGVGYYPTLTRFEFSNDILFDTLWKDNQTLKIWGKDLFAPENSFNLSLTISWNNIENTETFQEEMKGFDLVVKSETLPAITIKSSYPVDRQYYFLTKEYDRGFFLLDRLPADVSLFTMRQTAANGDIVATQEIIKNIEKSRLDFILPEMDKEEIYKMELVYNNETLYTIHFRTSMFDTFERKVESMELKRASRRANAFGGPYLDQEVTMPSESFDRIEIKSSLDSILYIQSQTQQSYFKYPYSSGLVQITFNPLDNHWFNDVIYPLLYEPFSDFTPTYLYEDHPKLGDKYVNTMEFYFENDLHSLTNEEIEKGIANQQSQAQFFIQNLVPSVSSFEFTSLQRQLTVKYLADNEPHEEDKDRVDRIIWGRFPSPGHGIYPYDLKYTLPDGTVTSTETLFMQYQGL